MPTKPKDANPNPHELALEIRDHIVQETGTMATWNDHVITSDEFARIRERVLALLDDCREKQLTKELKPTQQELEDFFAEPFPDTVNES